MATISKGWIYNNTITVRLFCNDVFNANGVAKKFNKIDILPESVLADLNLDVDKTNTKATIVDYYYDYDIDDVFVTLKFITVCFSIDSSKHFIHNFKKLERSVGRWNEKGDKKRKFRDIYARVIRNNDAEGWNEWCMRKEVLPWA